MNTRSIRFRLVAWHAVVALVICLGFGLYTYFGLSYFLRHTQAETLIRRANEIAAILASHIASEGESYTSDLIRTSYAPEKNDRFIRIRRPDGSVLYVSGVPTNRGFDPSLVPLIPAPTKHDAGLPITLGDLLMVQASAMVKGASYILDCGESKTPNTQVLQEFLLMLGFGIPWVLLIVVAGGATLVQQALKPVTKIIDAAKTITSSNLGQRLPIAETADEIEYLSIVLNRMIERLESALQHSQRFSADVSHELRTPLTIMRIELESISQSKNLDKSIQQKIGSILEETVKMGEMVERLLSIARLETGETVVTVSRFHLSSLVSSTVEQITLLAEEKQITMHCHATKAVEVNGDLLRIQQVIVNLLDNAIKYSPPGTEIHLTTYSNDREAILEVDDSGPGISPEAHPYVFDRFFRADSVRTHSISGTGLGLSIVRSICLAHGGTIEAINLPQGGCRLTMRLPMTFPAKSKKI